MPYSTDKKGFLKEVIIELRQRTKELNHKKTETKDEEVNQRKGKGKDKYSFGPNFEASSTSLF